MKKSKKNKVTEEEFLAVLDNITKRLANKFKFGYHSYEDMCQQAAIFALEGLDKYDNQRPLENFLWTHVRNRLFNFKRDNYNRPDKPCLTCPFFNKSNPDNHCNKYENPLDCTIYYKWIKRNDNKKNIMKPTTLEEAYNGSDTFFNNLTDNEAIKKIEDLLTGEHREIYLKLKHGVKVSKSQIKKLKSFISDIIDEQ